MFTWNGWWLLQAHWKNWAKDVHASHSRSLRPQGHRAGWVDSHFLARVVWKPGRQYNLLCSAKIAQASQSLTCNPLLTTSNKTVYSTVEQNWRLSWSLRLKGKKFLPDHSRRVLRGLREMEGDSLRRECGCGRTCSAERGDSFCLNMHWFYT